MKIKKSTSCILVIFFSLIFYSQAFSQETLSNYNTSWTSVLPGTVLCQPAITSYGFCIATDARNIMGYSSTGVLLWEQKTGRVKNLSLSVIDDDFILFHDIDKNVIRLFNPSGTEIWSKVLDFSLAEKPFSGRDGRFFLYGEKRVICIGINGIVRWTLETENQKALPMQELPDGSIIVFINDEDGKTKGLRISPFGEKLENITFAGSINTSASCKDGILLTFTDGSAGLFSLKDGLAKSQWVFNVKNGNPVFAVSPEHDKFYLLSLSKTQITIYKIDSKNGNVLASTTINEIDGTELTLLSYSDTGLLLADKNKTLLFDNDFRELWSAFMPDKVKKNSVNQIIYLKDDYLVFCDKNWSMNAYHTSQSTNSSKTVVKNIQSDYSSFAPVELNEINYFSEGGFYNSLKDPDRITKLKAGNYNSEEELWLSQTLSVAKLYSMNAGSSDFGIHTEKSVFEKDSAGTEAILLQLALLGTKQTQNASAAIIAESTNKSNCRVLLSNICGYDPDGKLLEAIAHNANRAGNKDSAYLKSICDAVYSICLFMGRPAWNKKGKDILKNFMGKEYSSTTRTYARDTLKKIISLEL